MTAARPCLRFISGWPAGCCRSPIRLYERSLGYLPVDPGPAVPEHDATRADKAGSLRRDLVLDSLDACLQLIRRLRGVDAQAPLQDARTAVELFCYKVYCAAVPLISGIEHALVRVQPWVLGK